MSLGKVLNGVWKAFTSPVEWITSPAGMLLDYGLDFLGNYYAQDAANKANLKLWREQAEYNKPINQLARLREAGLNPNLIYGSGGVQNTITSAPKMDSMNMPQLNLMAYQQVLNGKAQHDLLREQIKLTRAQENQTQLKTIGQIYDNVFKNLENEYKSYENSYLMREGTIKGQNITGSVLDKLTTYILGPLGKYLAGMVGDYVGRKFSGQPAIYIKDYSKYGGGLK